MSLFYPLILNRYLGPRRQLRNFACWGGDIANVTHAIQAGLLTYGST